MYLELRARRRRVPSVGLALAVGCTLVAVVLFRPAPEADDARFADVARPDQRTVHIDDLSRKRAVPAPAARPSSPHAGATTMAPPPRDDAPLDVAAIPHPDRFEVGGSLVREREPAARAAGDTPPLVDGPDPQAPAAPPRRRVDVKVASGDTLMGMLLRLGIGRAEAHAAIEGLRGVYDPRRLRPGQRLEIETDAAASRLVRLAFAPSGRERIELVRAEGGGFDALVRERPTVREERLVEATVETSLHAAATGGGMPAAVFAEVVKIFSWDVDYQRETRAGDELAVLFALERVPNGPVVGTGDVRYARLDVGGRVLEAFRFERDGHDEFFTRDGESLRKFLLRTPVSTGRMSSGFGMRRHPILGYTRMHRGVDFAAPTGTPIYAAGSGKLVRVGRYGSYGNYIRIRHGDVYATAYAHLSRFADGVRAGRRVEQGEVIGYVGSTGRSTGPHLHFEVLEHGRQVDPLGVAQPPADRLTGDELAAFRRTVEATETRLAELGGRTFAADPAALAASGG